MNKRFRHSRKKILSAIKDSGGIKLEIARRLKCSRTTVDKYIRRIPEVLEAYNEECESVGDICEAKIIKAIKEGSESMIRYYASTKLKKRGYTEKQEIEHSGEIHFDFIECSNIEDVQRAKELYDNEE